MKKIFPPLIVCLAVTCLTAKAQKLPALQKEGIYAPADIKIDGIASEWKYKFQAYNTGNHLYYTIANDDKNLYLVIHSAENQTVNKVWIGGITFSLVDAAHARDIKSSANKIAITYPIIKAINNGVYLQAKNSYDEYKRDSIKNSKKIKDLILLKNDQFNTAYKEFRIDGVKDLEDPIMSVYNTEGIKVKAAFNYKLDYTYELAIPLKYLATVLNHAGKLGYNIKLNGIDREGRRPYPTTHLIRPDGTEDTRHLYIDNPTDFGGVYSLAKK